MVDKDLDFRERWAGIRGIKKDYTPTPYARKHKQGQIVANPRRAETAAQYLSEDHWGAKI